MLSFGVAFVFVKHFLKGHTYSVTVDLVSSVNASLDKLCTSEVFTETTGGVGC